MPTPKKPKSEHRKPGRRPRAKKAQSTSAHRILREKIKNLALTYKKQEFTYTQIAEAVNAHFHPEADADEGAEPTPGFKPVSRHLICTLISEAIKESVDPLVAAEVREMIVMQHRALLNAMMLPALQGSVPHASQAQSLLRDLAKLIGLDGGEDDKGGGNITQIFVNGALADHV